ncbi:MAG: hypothetical protein Q9M23_02975 [Mariprofundaceae bacterium]|nr:hypothetical protein [Mariprofundaceae bacterium]
MNVIAFITLLQNHPAIGFLIALAFFALMFGIKNGIVLLYSRSVEKEKAARKAAEDRDGSQSRITSASLQGWMKNGGPFGRLF